MDVAYAERIGAERELDAFIERRASKDPDPNELEPSYAEGVRRYHAQKRETNRAAWCEYFTHLAGSLRSRAQEYDRRAEKLLADRAGGGDGAP